MTRMEQRSRPRNDGNDSDAKPLLLMLGGLVLIGIGVEIAFAGQRRSREAMPSIIPSHARVPLKAEPPLRPQPPSGGPVVVHEGPLTPTENSGPKLATCPPGHTVICGIVPGPNSCWCDAGAPSSSDELDPAPTNPAQSPARTAPSPPPDFEVRMRQVAYDMGYGGEPVLTLSEMAKKYSLLGQAERRRALPRRDLAANPPTATEWRLAGLSAH